MRQVITVRRWALVCIAAAAVLVPQVSNAQGLALVQFDTELVELDYTGGPFAIPLASDPSNNLGDSVDGYGYVNSEVTFTLSSQRPVNPGPASSGSVCAFEQQPAKLANCGAPPAAINPEDLDGVFFFVDSFFDVFFDLTFTDVDSRPGRDYAGMPDGASITLLDNGPSSMSSSYAVVFDKDAPNYALFPPAEADPYVGFFLVEIPLGGDINGNGENDKIKFTLGIVSVGDQNRSFITLPDKTVINEWDGGMRLEGAVVDESTDPPFIIGATLSGGLPDPGVFGGPTTATSELLNQVPVPVDGMSWGAVKAMYRSEEN